MEELRLLVVQAQSGSRQAYDLIVRQLQDVAVAYGYSVLGDKGLAEDAAQEAFVEAFFCLASLQEPAAFSGWFRRIVWKHCDRLTRKKQLKTVSLEAALDESAPYIGAQERLEKAESASQVQAAIAALPEHERVAVLLFYMGQHSQQQIAEFLEVPVTTVKKRLQRARLKLREMMIQTMQNNFEKTRHANKDGIRPFAEESYAFTADFSRLINQGHSIVRSLAQLAMSQSNPQLREAIEQTNQRVQNGSDLSVAMRHHSDVFDAAMVEAIRSGEVGGNLKDVLEQLAQYKPSQNEQFALRVKERTTNQEQ